MPANSHSDASAFIRRLESVFALEPDEKAALGGLPVQLQDVRADQDLVREGDRPSRCCLILEGFACVYKITGEGRRQITSFQLLGDVPDLMSLHLRTLDSSIGTLSPCRVAFIRHEDVRELGHRWPRLLEAFWRTTLIDAAIFREWIANIGQRDASGRIAHLLCETFMRMRAVGRASEHACEFPITQQRLGEATSMSTVHVNRTLQDLRAAGLIELQKGKLTILDWDRLQDVGDFDPEYLHLVAPVSPQRPDEAQRLGAEP